jgi:hypothetical protein
VTNINIKVAHTEHLPPDEEKSADIYSRLGYKFSDAIADLIDNSLDENANKVHIRFVRGLDGIHYVIIADNGNGMNDGEFKEAMRFGSRSVKSEQDLGKYGILSIAYCRLLEVYLWSLWPGAPFDFKSLFLLPEFLDVQDP